MFININIKNYKYDETFRAFHFRSVEVYRGSFELEKLSNRDPIDQVITKFH